MLFNRCAWTCFIFFPLLFIFQAPTSLSLMHITDISFYQLCHESSSKAEIMYEYIKQHEAKLCPSGYERHNLYISQITDREIYMPVHYRLALCGNFYRNYKAICINYDLNKCSVLIKSPVLFKSSPLLDRFISYALHLVCQVFIKLIPIFKSRPSC